MAILAYDDVMLRAPELLIPGRQPLGLVRIDRSHPYSAGLRLCIPANGPVDVVTGRTIAFSGTGKIGPTDRGLALIGNTSAATGSIPITWQARTTEITISFWLYLTGTPDANDILLETSINSNAAAGTLQINAGYTGTKLAFASSGGNSTNYNLTTIARPSVNAWHHCVFKIDTLADINQWAIVDKQQQSVTHVLENMSGQEFTDQTLYLLSRNNSVLYCGAYIQQLCIWNRGLTLSEGFALADNPTQFLIPA